LVVVAELGEVDNILVSSHENELGVRDVIGAGWFDGFIPERSEPEGARSGY